MNYKYFKSKVHSMMVDGKNQFDEQETQDLYTEFKKYWKKYSLKQFMQFWFQDWTIDNNGTELKKQ